MKEQPSLPFATIRANVTVHHAAKPRVERQATRILQRLRQGRMSNMELKAIACQYTARIWELRRAGYVIENVQINHRTGESWYELKQEP